MNAYDAVVLILGAASEIGGATAEAFDRAGAKVALAGLPEQRLEELSRNIEGALVLPTDVAQADAARAAVERTISHFGRIDILVNFTIPTGMMRSEQLTAGDVRGAMDTNLIGPMAATQLAARSMHQAGRGHIVNVGFPGFLLGVPMMAPYAASAAAVSGWTRAMQAEWAGSGVDVTEFFLGRVKTAGDGPVDPGDVFRDPAQSPLVRLLVHEQAPNVVAKAIVDSIRTPSGTSYSSLGVRILSFLGLFAGVRVFLGSKMADGQRLRSGGVVFASEKPATPRAAPVAASALAATPQAPSEAEPSKPVVKPAAKKAPVAKKTSKKTAKKTTRKTTAKATTKKRTSKTAAKRSAAKKVVALSPEATARVKAAAKRAAASAKGKKSSGSDSES